MVHTARRPSLVMRLIIVTSPLTYLLIYLLTYSTEQSPSWEVTGSQRVKKFPTFYGTRRFIIAFRSARHLSQSWARSIQSLPPHPTSWRSILILSPHPRLGLPSGLYPSGFPTKTLCTPLLFPIRATCPANLILLEHLHLILKKIFFHSRYSPLWALACRTILLHFSLSTTNSLHLLTPITWRSLSTSSLHPILGLPLRLVPSLPVLEWRPIFKKIKFIFLSFVYIFGCNR